MTINVTFLLLAGVVEILYPSRYIYRNYSTPPYCISLDLGLNLTPTSNFYRPIEILPSVNLIKYYWVNTKLFSFVNCFYVLYLDFVWPELELFRAPFTRPKNSYELNTSKPIYLLLRPYLSRRLNTLVMKMYFSTLCYTFKMPTRNSRLSDSDFNYITSISLVIGSDFYSIYINVFLHMSPKTYPFFNIPITILYRVLSFKCSILTIIMIFIILITLVN